ncbi:hypothetical protein RhiirB3_424844, partial [Rhizophagus irregularis]
MYKVNYFIQGLSPTMISRVMETAPATLDAAIERAKIIETGNQMVLQSVMNQSLLNRNNVQNNNTQDVRQNDNGKNDKRHGENEDLYVRKTTEYRKCHRKGHFATRCPLGNNIRRNERRVNLMDTGNYGRDDEYEEYEKSDDNYDYEYEEYDDPQLYSYERDLYEKDNPVQERRISNRINPVQGWKNFGKPNLDKDI